MHPVIKNLETDAELLLFAELLSGFYKEIEHVPPAGMALYGAIKDFLSVKKNVIKVVFLDGEMIGCISLQEATAIYAGGKYGIINELYVRPKYRSKGIGKTLMQCAEEMKEINGWTRFEVSTPDENQWRRTVDFYLKEGFIRTGLKLKR